MKGPRVGKRVDFPAERRSLAPAAFPLAFLLGLGLPRHARAEDFVAYKYEDYSETGGRIGVHTQGLLASEDLGPDMNISFSVLNDAIAGASPTGEVAPAGSTQVPLAHLADHRKAWEADFSRQLGRVNVAVGYSQSREHDYVSRGWSLNTLTDFNQKNTTLLVGIAGHDDNVETFFESGHPYQDKQAFTAIVGVKQLLDPLTFVTLNVTWGRETGYLDDQYKVVGKTVELVPGSFFPLVYAENLPGERDLGIAYAAVNRAVPSAHAALEASYRYYADTYGIVTNTAELAWIQKLGSRVTLEPNLRFSRQESAKFYYYNLDDTDIMPTQIPNPSGTHYSSDYRLSSFDAVGYGLKATWQIAEHLQVDLRYGRYDMRGRDGVTPRSAYPTANVYSAGVRIMW
jgi:hypothetical protein